MITEIAISDTTTAGATSLQATIMHLLNSLAWTVAKTAIQSMTRSIVTWINSGFEGSPAFVTDLNRNLRGLADTVAMEFFQNLNADVIDSPFLEQVALGVGTAYYLNSSQDRISRRLRYTLNEYSRNDRAFLDGDFREGGFNAWFSLWLDQANNPIGAHYIAGQELGSQIEAEAFERLQELMYGRGFMSWRGECTLRADPETVSLGSDEGCLKYDTLTPGTVIERQLSDTLKSPMDQLELADSIDEIVAALAVQMVTQVASASGLLGTTRPSSGGGSSILNRATDPSQYARSTTNSSQGLSVRMTADRSSVQSYQSAWERIRSAGQRAQQALQGAGTCTDREVRQQLVTQTLSDADAAMSRSQQALAALNNLISRIPAQGATGGADTLSTVGNEYVTLISSGNIPSASAVSRAQNDARDSSGTLYSQLMEIVRECGT